MWKWSWELLQFMYQEQITIFLETSRGLKGASEVKKRVMNLEKMHQRTYVAIDRWRCYTVWSFCIHIHYFVYVHRIRIYNLCITHTTFSPTFMHPSATWKDKHALPCFNGKGQSGMCPKSTTTSKVWRVAETAVRSWGPVVGFGPLVWRLMDGPFCTRGDIWH